MIENENIFPESLEEAQAAARAHTNVDRVECGENIALKNEQAIGMSILDTAMWAQVTAFAIADGDEFSALQDGEVPSIYSMMQTLVETNQCICLALEKLAGINNESEVTQ